MTNIIPETKMPKLIVVMAFDRDEEGELQLRLTAWSSRARNGRSERRAL